MSKHSFNTDAAAAELSRQYNKTIDSTTGYNQWKEDYEKKQVQQEQERQALFEQLHSLKRKPTDEPETKKKKGNVLYNSKAIILYY